MAFKYAIALTGGIATGKSTVASLLKLHGFRIIDADEIAHKILDSLADEIKNLFGDKYIKDNKVDRKKLGELIFSNKDKKKVLEELLHPKIKEKITNESIKQDSFSFPYFIDIPLFFENKNYPIKNSVVVYAPKDLQLKRILKRDNLTKENALKRINSQIDIEKKKKLATWVIDNSKDLKYLQNEVEKIVEIVKNLKF